MENDKIYSVYSTVMDYNPIKDQKDKVQYSYCFDDYRHEIIVKNNANINKINNISNEILSLVNTLKNTKVAIDACYMLYYNTLNNNLNLFNSITEVTPILKQNNLHELLNIENYILQISEVRKLFLSKYNEKTDEYVDLFKDYKCLAVIDRNKALQFGFNTLSSLENSTLQTAFIDFVFSDFKNTFAISVPKKIPMDVIMEYYSSNKLYTLKSYKYGNILISTTSDSIFNINKDSTDNTRIVYYSSNDNKYPSWISYTSDSNPVYLNTVYYSYNINDIKEYLLKCINKK